MVEKGGKAKEKRREDKGRKEKRVGTRSARASVTRRRITNCLVFLVYTPYTSHTRTRDALCRIRSRVRVRNQFPLCSRPVPVCLFSPLAALFSISFPVFLCVCVCRVPNTRPTCKSCGDLVYLRDSRHRARFPKRLACFSQENWAIHSRSTFRGFFDRQKIPID